jgi:hypothetical protein
MAKMPTINPGNINAALAVERQRISAIMESPEGLLRPEAARQLALRSTMDAQSAVDFLKTIPAANPYVLAMQQQGPIDLGGSNVGAPVSTDAKAKRMEEIEGSMAHFAADMGYKHNKIKA